MEYDPTLSQRLTDQIDDRESSDQRELSPEDRAEARKNLRFVKIVVDAVITSRETLTDARLAAVEKLVEAEPELIRHALDDRFTRELLEAVPGYVCRTMQLSRLEGSLIPSAVTSRYLREAVRTYILGLPQASVALSRAALEQALKEKLKGNVDFQNLQATDKYITRKKLLSTAEKARVIDVPIRQMALEIASEADSVLHETPTSLPKAYEILVKLRGVLQHIYSS